MKRRFFIVAAVLVASGWTFSGCLQGTGAPVGQMETAGGDPEVADNAPPSVDAGAAAEPIDPKTDPRTIGGGTSGTEGTDTGTQNQVVLGGSIPLGPIKQTPFVDARIRSAKDSQILPDSPAVPYAIFGKTSKVSLSFTTEVTWDPNLADAEWLPILDNFDTKPQLRAVFTASEDPNHPVYCDAAQTADESGRIVYSFSDIQVSEGRLRFFLRDAPTADVRTGGFTALSTGDADHPFAASTGGNVYEVGAYKVKANVVSKAPEVQQQVGPSIHLNLP